MKLYTHCKSCKEDITIKSDAQTRPDLQMEKGDEFSVNCLSCGKQEKKHVNDVRGEPNKQILLAGFGIGVLISLGLFYFYGLIGILGLAIPLILGKQQMDTVKGFNSYLIRRK